MIGGGITGLAAAHELLTCTSDSDDVVVVYEGDDRVGGKLRTSQFAGLDVDEGADAFLTRVPHAVDLARVVGLSEELVAPTSARAAIWHRRLHEIPNDLMLGVPTSMLAVARSGLLSPLGLSRAALDVVLPKTSIRDDNLGRWVQRRFGREVHDRLVDALVGSIYGADTNNFSLAAVPQLSTLATSGRSGLRTSRKLKANSTPTTAAIFGAPRTGMETFAQAILSDVEHRYSVRFRLCTGTTVTSIDADGDQWRINDEQFDGVVIALPAHLAARLLGGSLGQQLDEFECADVAIVTARIPQDEWPDRCQSRSGYLVPKSVQRAVTAVSFTSQKWAHLQPDDGSQVIRISLGRDGLPIGEFDNAGLVSLAAEDVSSHLGIAIDCSSSRVTRWKDAFTQYRPHHHVKVASIAAQLPPMIELAGSSYRGIGIPACVADGQRAARHLASAGSR